MLAWPCPLPAYTEATLCSSIKRVFENLRGMVYRSSHLCCSSPTMCTYVSCCESVTLPRLSWRSAGYEPPRSSII